MSTYSEEISAEPSWPVEATRRMNRMYRRQRHIYDGTRRYYLLGRDQLIANLEPKAGGTSGSCGAWPRPATMVRH